MLSLCIIGRGKLGQAVADLATDTVRVNVISREEAKEISAFQNADVIVCATPGAHIFDVIPALFATTKPVIMASTGHDWPRHLDKKLQEGRQLWIAGQNFSLGLQSFRHGLLKMLYTFERAGIPYELSIHEIHDITKLDSPSGTARLLQHWTKAAKITSERIAGAMPEHVITIALAGEKFEMRHVVDNRTPYAEGIVLLAQHLKNGHYRKYGLHSFEAAFDSIFDLELKVEHRYVPS